MVASQVISRRDVEFLLYEWLDVVSLVDRPRFSDHDRSTFDGVIDMAETMAVQTFAPINRLLDETEPRVGESGRVEQPAELSAALKVFAESGLTASTFDIAHGGAQLPAVVRAACAVFLQAASISAYAYPFLSEANANLLVAFGTPEQIRLFAHPIIEGRWYGTMCLSEPQAGSALNDIATAAVAGPDGSYRLRGTKMWISGGDHELAENIVHLVLAKTERPDGAGADLSLFAVPRYLVAADGSLGERNDVALAGLNHKMGYRGTVNTVLSFGEGAWTPGGAPGAVGHLVGEEGRGLEYMFHMMDEARIGVGSGAVALGYTGYLRALDYARERTQGRRLGGQADEPGSVPISEHPDVRRMLLAQKSYAEGGLALILYCARLVDEERAGGDATECAQAAALLRLLTPIAKSWPSQWCLKGNDLAIQVHGGYGYTRDFPVEQLYRDNRLNPIHEGTHGIQALDLLGRRVHRNDGADLHLLIGRMLATCRRGLAGGGVEGEHAAAVERWALELERVTQALSQVGDRVEALANAAYYLDAFGHIVVAWLWLEQELVAKGRVGGFYDGKRWAARYFFRYELPAIEPWLRLVEQRDRTTIDLDPATI
ncbi:acyl-CoA dehydrogenase [Microbacterium sp. MYb64]|uniref:acyl-CoA dehydrogenase n=1 Tax=Microbacterium sp. MYb64 TaxID=1848691 RepID=UPI000CFCABE6|nr:acyl-CoA dehydrogenase [Microbacterium sp. MYb64]PRB07519.1 acyl-CoA dehydrogenase [Microbacterium sp. MYb64]